MALRIDLMQDPTFRKDIMDLIGGMLRDLGEVTIRAVVKEEGWLEKRVDAYVLRHPMDAVVWDKIVHAIRATPGPIIAAVKDAVLPDLRRSLDAVIGQHMTAFKKDAQKWVEQTVRAELQRLLGNVVGK